MPKYNQPRKTWFYPVNFKIKAVELSLRDDIMSKEIAHALDIHRFKCSLKLTLRGIDKVNTQWQMYSLVHNIEKLRSHLH